MDQNELIALILDDTNQLIQVSDCKEYKMLYANQTARAFTSHAYQDYKGAHCYQYMMGLEEQCPFCPMLQMKDQDSFVTEVDNGRQVFQVKTKLIEWEGQSAFVEYATDITTIKRAQQIFEYQMQTLLQSIPEAQGIFHLNLTRDEVLSSNGVSHNVERLRKMHDVDTLFLALKAFIPNEDQGELFYQGFHRLALQQAYQSGQNERVMEVESYYDDGSIRWARLTARLIMNPNTGDLECVFYGMDIHDEKSYREQVQVVQNEKQEIVEKSKKDMLTGVLSKKAFEQMANDYLHTCPGQPFVLVFLDLDHFKDVNDVLGHLTGDRAIIEVAERLQTIFSNKDLVSRFGGDEFCVLVKDIPEETLVCKLDFVLKELRRTYRDEQNQVSITTSMGVVFSNGRVENILELVQEADVALYQAKRAGRDRYCIRHVNSGI